MDRRLLFNEDVINYDRYRPCYCKALFDDIMAFASLKQGMRVIEIGIGTGQATAPFLSSGCDLTAIELGPDLAAYTQEKYKAYHNFQIINTSFEDYECEDNSVDLIYAATAFHWIPEAIAYPKVLRLLKPKGTLALFWNKPFVAREDDELHRRIQTIYNQFRPSDYTPIEHDENRYARIAATIRSYGFLEIETKLYHQKRLMGADEYIGLLNTYSDHREIVSEIKADFEKEIHRAIIEHGNQLHVYDTIDLYLARK